MCKCISEIEKKMLGLKYKEKEDILKASFISAALIFEQNSKVKLKASGEIELTVASRKKPVKQLVVYTYCPFCGEKY